MLALALTGLLPSYLCSLLTAAKWDWLLLVWADVTIDWGPGLV